MFVLLCSNIFSPITFYSYFILDAIKTRHQRLRLEVRDFLKLKHVTDLQKYGSLTTRLLLLGIAESSNNIKKPSMIMLVAPPSLRTMQVQQQEWMRTTERKNRMK